MLWGNSAAIENRMAHTLRVRVNYLKSERNRIKKTLSHIRLSIHLSNCIMPWIGMNGGRIWMQLFCVCASRELSLFFLAVLWHVECYFMCLQRIQSVSFFYFSKSCLCLKQGSGFTQLTGLGLLLLGWSWERSSEFLRSFRLSEGPYLLATGQG